MEVSYNTIRGSLNVTPDQNQNQPLNLDLKDSSGSCFLIFDGLDLTEDGLKDWLRRCATQVGSEPVLIHGRSSLRLGLQTQDVHIRVSVPSDGSWTGTRSGAPSCLLSA